MYNDYNMYQQGYRPQQMNPYPAVNYQVPQQKQSNLEWIMVQNEPIFALRSANNMGLVSTETYKFEKYEEEKETKEVAADYVTKDEMNAAIKNAIKELKDESINATD